MSRSFGDMAAETVGVFADPELSEVLLSPADRVSGVTVQLHGPATAAVSQRSLKSRTAQVIIWASDGVWEFISSQEAIDIVMEKWNEGPLEAAAALVKESVVRWRVSTDTGRVPRCTPPRPCPLLPWMFAQEEEEVVDDTTAIVAFLNYAPPPPPPKATASASLDGGAAVAGPATSTSKRSVKSGPGAGRTQSRRRSLSGGSADVVPAGQEGAGVGGGASAGAGSAGLLEGPGVGVALPSRPAGGFADATLPGEAVETVHLE